MTHYHIPTVIPFTSIHLSSYCSFSVEPVQTIIGLLHDNSMIFEISFVANSVWAMDHEQIRFVSLNSNEACLQIRVNPFNAAATLAQSTRTQRFLKTIDINTVMLVFIG